jgi:hypothetical protein
VSPAFERETQLLWAACRDRDLLPALFVVPNWHGQWPLVRHPSFVRWLHQRADEGAEIFLHGERHDEQGTSRGWSDQLRAIGRTTAEGEFLTLDCGEAERRMQRGLAVFQEAGIEPIGFVAPAWLWQPHTRSVANSLGLPISEDEHAIYLLRRGTRLESPVIRWSARTAARATTSAIVARTMTWLHRRHWLMRIALHPTDLWRATTIHSAMRTIDWWRARRHPWSYSAL